MTTAVREAADLLRNAADTGKPCLPIRMWKTSPGAVVVGEAPKPLASIPNPL